MVDLTEGQFELLESSDEDADGLLLGGSSVIVTNFDPGTPDLTDKDTARPMSDGVFFGRDFRGGRVLTLEMTAVGPEVSGLAAYESADPVAAAMDTADQVLGAWASDRVRLVPNAVQVLRWRAGGRTRRVYGRPRKCAPNLANYHAGTVPLTADFQAGDDLVYSDLRKVTTVGIVVPPLSFTTWPLRWPVVWQRAESSQAASVVVGGTRPTWPSFTIHGPILNPTIVVGGYGQFMVNTNLLSDQTLYIDTRPWNRGIRRENGANLAGLVDVRATPLSQFQFPPGSYSVALKGVDTTGTASLVVEHRDAYNL